MITHNCDSPLSLIPTPHKQTGKTDDFTMCASQMALVHNVAIRGYNSIYQQAPLLKSVDHSDFMGYCLAWHQMMEDHLNREEKILYPSIEAATKVKEIMDEAMSEHRTFSDGLDQFKSYLVNCTKAPADFRATELLAIMDSFGSALHIHLANEPLLLASLVKYPIEIKALAKNTQKHGVPKTSAVNLLPVLWFNLDLEFEDGKWKDFPPVPTPVRWVMINILGRWRFNWWRFGSCGPDGKRVRLLASRDEYFRKA